MVILFIYNIYYLTYITKICAFREVTSDGLIFFYGTFETELSNTTIYGPQHEVDMKMRRSSP